MTASARTPGTGPAAPVATPADTKPRSSVAPRVRPDAGAVPAYFPALDGLRFFCASAVIVSHAFFEPRIVADTAHPLHAFVENLGSTGVRVFFSLSGFLITKLLLDEVRSHGRVDLRSFYIRRTLRIWPVYYVALAVGFGLTALLGERFTRPLGYTVQPELWSVALPMHVAFLGNWSNTIIPSSLRILWSVCVEEQFYLLFPATFVWRKARHPVVLPVVLGLLLAWGMRGGLAAADAPEGAIYRNTFAHADHLLLGAGLAQLLHAAPERLIAAVRRAGLTGELLAIGGVVVLTALEAPKTGAPVAWLVSYFASAIVMTFVVAMIGLGDGPIARALARPALRRLGGLTYAAYAFHIYGVVVAWALCRRLLDTPWLGASLRGVVAIPIAFAIAWASKHVVEDRFLAYKKRFQPTPSRRDERPEETK